jgi:hypothetical protein
VVKAAEVHGLKALCRFHVEGKLCINILFVTVIKKLWELFRDGFIRCNVPFYVRNVGFIAR